MDDAESATRWWITVAVPDWSPRCSECDQRADIYFYRHESRESYCLTCGGDRELHRVAVPSKRFRHRFGLRHESTGKSRRRRRKPKKPKPKQPGWVANREWMSDEQAEMVEEAMFRQREG